MHTQFTDIDFIIPRLRRTIGLIDVNVLDMFSATAKPHQVYGKCPVHSYAYIIMEMRVTAQVHTHLRGAASGCSLWCCVSLSRPSLCRPKVTLQNPWTQRVEKLRSNMYIICQLLILSHPPPYVYLHGYVSYILPTHSHIPGLHI